MVGIFFIFIFMTLFFKEININIVDCPVLGLVLVNNIKYLSIILLHQIKE